jgi:hypothetical protein
MEIWITIIASILAASFSLLSYLHSRRVLASEILSKQRIEWMEKVRLALFDYISNMRNTRGSIEQVRLSQNKVELYLNPNNEDHKPILNTIKICSEKYGVNCEASIAKLVEEAQVLINIFWRVIKAEVGVADSIQKKHIKLAKRKKIYRTR